MFHFMKRRLKKGIQNKWCVDYEGSIEVMEMLKMNRGLSNPSGFYKID